MQGTTFRVLPRRALKLAVAAGLMLVPALYPAQAEEMEAQRQPWTFSGMTGHYDTAQLQRGFQVYKEVCASCHSLRLIKYRNLAEPGGPGFTEGQVKTLIKDVTFEDEFDDAGNPKKRPAVPADAFKPPFPSAAAAKAANNGSLPPDLSLMARARELPEEVPFYALPAKWLRVLTTSYQQGGPDYIHALLTSFHDKAPAYAADAGGKLVAIDEAKATKDSLRCASINVGEAGAKDECVKVGEGLYYNTAFPGHQIAMPPPLASDGQVAYSDGTKATVDQYARDVAAFLAWTADPTLDERKDVGLRMAIYLLILCVLLWFAKRQVWSRLH